MPTITRQKLTMAIVEKLICPPGQKEAYFWDEEIRGLGLRVYSGGRRSWVFIYRNADGRRLRSTLKATDLPTARLEAGQLSRSVAVGGDPQADAKARRLASTVLEVIELYLPVAEARQTVRTHAEVKRALMIGAKALHPLKAGRVTRRDVVGVLDDVAAKSGGVAANRVRAYLSAMWSWALRSGHVEGINPVAHTPRPVEEAARDRVLTDAELALIWRCTDGGGDYHRAVRLLMLTGARLAEVGGMLAAELDTSDVASALWVIGGDRTKNGLPSEVPLTPLAVAQLPEIKEGATCVFGLYGSGFSGWSKSKERLNAAMLADMVEAFKKANGREPAEGEVALADWRHHDLRRTLSTGLSEMGIEPHVVEACLNHVSGTAKRGVAGVYNKAQYRPQKRAALTAWERHIRNVCGLPALPSNVKEFKSVA